MEKTLEGKQVSSSLFLYVAQAFDKVWHEGLFHKLEFLLPTEYSLLLKSSISGRYFRDKQDDEYSELKPIKAGVPQGSVMGPVLYLLYTSDLPQPDGTTVASFEDDTAIMAVVGNVDATEKLQRAADEINDRTRAWLIKLIEDKSLHVAFTNKRYTGNYEWQNHTSLPHREVLWHDTGCQAALEGPCQEKTRRA